MNRIKKIVLDTSVIVKWLAWKNEKDLDKAKKLLDHIEQGQLEAIICEFAYFELGNVLYWSKQLNKQNYVEAIKNLFSLPFISYTFTEKIIKSIYLTMDKFQLSLYDAFPLVIANIEKCPFITADEKHHKNLPNVIFLKDYK